MELALSKGKVYGTHTIQCNLYICFSDVVPNRESLEDWCIETFGPTSTDGVLTPDMRWYMNNRKFWFSEEKDLTCFVLRWA